MHPRLQRKMFLSFYRSVVISKRDATNLYPHRVLADLEWIINLILDLCVNVSRKSSEELSVWLSLCCKGCVSHTPIPVSQILSLSLQRRMQFPFGKMESRWEQWQHFAYLRFVLHQTYCISHVAVMALSVRNDVFSQDVTCATSAFRSKAATSTNSLLTADISTSWHFNEVFS